MIWPAISWNCAGLTVTPNRRITAGDYVDILGNRLHLMAQMFFFPNNDATFQDGNSPIHTARSVQSWFEDHEEALQLPPWPVQSPD